MDQIKAVVDDGPNLRCRFHIHKYPKEQDLVVVEVVEVQENASYVELLEYDRIKGMITPNEMTKTMKGGMQKVLRIGKQQIVRVLRVDEDQGYIDLSKKKVSKDEEGECLQNFANAKMVYSIMRAIAEKSKVNIEELYQTIVWPLQTKKGTIDVLPYFKHALTQGKNLGLKLEPQIQVKLMDEIERRLKPEPISIRCEFDLQCFEYAGLLVIKDALSAGMKKGTEECQILFEMYASPIYTGKCTTTNKNGIQIMKDALSEIEQVMSKYNGSFKIKQQPKVIGDPSKHDLFQEDIDEDENENQDDGIQQEEPEDDLDGDDDDMGMQ